ncbi:MAG: DUF389 domain-containing protein [Muribaculaceae bacterium]|nr:DUF389 domain-containing protein [Muribaculaceae bacterium]
MAENFWTKLKSLTGNYFALAPYLVTQQEAEASIREGVSFRGTNLIILVLAIFIASLGLNTNSTAVIIGAMLISPLMGPIIGIGLGIGITDFELLKRSLRNLVVAALFSMLASSLYFLISPVAEGHSELLARTSPTIYDVLIGFFGGGAGIVATCSRSKGNVIPGVAIATALMPPLCTAGYGLATLQMHYFLGASYLFIINSIFICLATFIGVKLFQFKPVTAANPERVKRIRRITYTVALLTLLPSVYLTYNMMRMNRFELNAGRFISHECQWPDTHVLSSSETWGKDGRQINLTLIGKAMPQDSLLIALSSRLHFYNLEGTKLKIFQGDAPMSVDELKSAAVSDIYHISQTAIQSKQAEIDSLTNILAADRASFGAAADILPELRVVFPKVNEIAVTKAVFANPAEGRTDTVNIALIHTASGFTAAGKTELQRYLEARLKLDEIKVIEIPRVIR